MSLSIRYLSMVLALAMVSSAFAADVEIPKKDLAWIWDSTAAGGNTPGNEPLYVRGTLDLAAAPKQGELFITCDNVYTVWVNGEKVGSDSEWNSLDKYDVTRRLVVGKNAIAVEANNEGGAAGLIAWLKVTAADGKTTIFGTGPAWKISATAPADWKKPAFDDSGWTKATPLGGPEIGPWNLAPGVSGSTVQNIAAKSYLSAEEEKKHFELPPGFEIELVVGDPLIINPVCLELDEKGRLYVSESHTYRFGPSGSPVPKATNPIVRLDPLPGGGFKRTLVAEGFADPVMGMAIRDGKLWATANDYLFRFDLTEEGLATNKQQLLVDKNKAWNPFGNFVLEWGPEGLLYMSIGDHNIDITASDGSQIKPGKHTGVISRMKPDATRLETLSYGLRVPYSFEFDPFGQLWLLSNGEGNPNRFVRAIQGVDYHCYTRSKVDNEWLAGRHPLAPPTEELPRGACTQLVRYYGAAYPAEFQGSLFLDNWGAHGFGGPNRTIFRYVPDELGQIKTREPWLVCKDPHFRCSHLLLDPEGNMLISDWYGRDDESDLTGRVWRVKYVGTPELPKPAIETHKFDAPEWTEQGFQIAALGSPSHLARELAMTKLAAKGNDVLAALAKHAETSKQPLGAANALWTLARIGTAGAWGSLGSGVKNADPQVRRLALRLIRRRELFGSPLGPNELAGNALPRKLEEAVAAGLSDENMEVRVEAATLQSTPSAIAAALVATIEAAAAKEQLTPQLRYEAAWNLAKVADEATLKKLVGSKDSEIRLAGLIAIDAACYEKLASKPAALALLGELLQSPGEIDRGLLFTLTTINPDPANAAALEKLLAREDVAPEVTAQALLALRAQGTGSSAAISAGASRKFLDAAAAGKVKLTTTDQQLLLFQLLELEPPTPFALAQIAPQLVGKQSDQLRGAANQLARKHGLAAAALAPALWTRLNKGSTSDKPSEKLEWLTTVLAIDPLKDQTQLKALLADGDLVLVRDAIRSLRMLKGRDDLVATVLSSEKALLERDATLADDLTTTIATIKNTPAPALDEAALRTQALAAESKEPHVALGRRVFERANCVSCHTTVSQTSLRAPSLQGIGKAQKPEYLVESLFEPSKVIKTGFEIETVTTADGRVLAGLVKVEGDNLRIITVDKELVLPKKEVEERAVQKKSLMPDGLWKELSPSELRDLVAYLESLK